MSGKTEKKSVKPAAGSDTTTAQKDIKGTPDTTVKTDPASLAPVTSADGQTSQSTVTATDGEAGPESDATATIAGVTPSPETDHSHLQDAGGNTVMAALCQSVSDGVHISGDVTVLEVRAIPEGGFHRAGRFWPHDPVHIFVSDDPDEQVLEDGSGQPLYGCVISTADASRLKREKMLVVTELKPEVEES